MEKTSEVDRSNIHLYLDSITNISFYYFHVDNHEILQTLLPDLTFGGNLSVQKARDSKHIIILGQDKYIFKQYTFVKKTRNTQDGKVPLVPKSEGQGVILSSFICREYDPIHLLLINKKGGMKIMWMKLLICTNNGTILEPALTESPFLQKLIYGTNLNGYCP